MRVVWKCVRREVVVFSFVDREFVEVILSFLSCFIEIIIIII